jgi:hypothetical protein
MATLYNKNESEGLLRASFFSSARLNRRIIHLEPPEDPVHSGVWFLIVNGLTTDLNLGL